MANFDIGQWTCAIKVHTCSILLSRCVCYLYKPPSQLSPPQLGGDGTVLFTSWLFQRIVPPVLPFALGSLGFLTNFDFNDHQAVMDSVIDSGIRVNLRMRFTCTVYRAVAQEKGKGRKAVKKAQTGEIMMKDLEKGGWEALEGGFAAPEVYGKTGKDKEIMCFTTRPAETFEVINELVVDRGPSPYVSLLELFGQFSSAIGMQDLR